MVAREVALPMVRMAEVMVRQVMMLAAQLVLWVMTDKHMHEVVLRQRRMNMMQVVLVEQLVVEDFIPNLFLKRVINLDETDMMLVGLRLVHR